MDQSITAVLTKDMKLKRKIGRIIAVTLDNHDGITDDDKHGYYIDNQNRLYLSYPSSYCAMDREIAQEDIVQALNGLDGDSSIEDISQAIANYFAI